MAFIETDVSNRSFVQLLNTTRRFAGDTSTNTSNQRWSDHEVYEAIGFELAKMWNEAGIQDHGSLITEESLTYTGGATEVALGDSIRTTPITRVMDLTQSTTSPSLIPRVSPHELSSYQKVLDNRPTPGYVWARHDYAIRIRPIPTGNLTLSIYRIHAPYLLAWASTSDDDLSDTATITDSPKIYAGHEELVCLGAAMRLKRLDGESSDHEFRDYNILWDQFVAGAKKFRGPRYVRKNRRWS